MLTPFYEAPVQVVLDQVEVDPKRERLWSAICDAVDLVCDHPDSAEARYRQRRGRDDTPVWQVPLRNAGEDDRWVMMWLPRGDEARIVYIGPDL